MEWIKCPNGRKLKKKMMNSTRNPLKNLRKAKKRKKRKRKKNIKYSY